MFNKEEFAEFRQRLYMLESKIEVLESILKMIGLNYSHTWDEGTTCALLRDGYRQIGVDGNVIVFEKVSG